MSEYIPNGRFFFDFVTFYFEEKEDDIIGVIDCKCSIVYVLGCE